jgi:hypothetical protein
MFEPLSHGERSPRHSLPYLLAGQAQKEFTLNEALARLDALLAPVVEGIASSPPPSPEPGHSWLVGENATGAWQGRKGQLANWQGDQWVYLAPVEGFGVYDRSTAARRTYAERGWRDAGPVAAPEGGTVVDEQARTAIVAILQALSANGLLPPPDRN